MQTPQAHEGSLSRSEQRPSLTPAESPNVDSAPKSSQGVFAALENASLKTQQLVIAITAAVISALGVVAVIQISAYKVQPEDSTALSQLNAIALVAFITGLTVGLTTLGLARITTNQINRSLDNLQAQFKAVAQGDLGVQATVYSPNELGQLAISFNQMTQALNTRLNEPQRKTEEQEKEDLQKQLMQVSPNLELTSNTNLIVEGEVITIEDDEQAVTPPGTLLDFLDNLHNWFKVTTDSSLLAGSSIPEELQQRKDELLYRQVWLQALQDETSRELQVLSLICQTPDQDKIRETQEG